MVMRLVFVTALFFLAGAVPAQALPIGGMTEPGSMVERAKLVRGKALPPASAPPRVRAVIRAANRIRNKPYVWGGGHGTYGDRWPIEDGYDCSGSVSYALRGGKFLRQPLVSGSLARWGKRGRGRWITVWANNEHVYMTVAGLRFDTSGGRGPKWHRDDRSSRGFRARYPRGY